MKSAFIIFDGITFLDFIGFYDATTRLKSMKIMDGFDWHVCSTKKSVLDDRGLRIEASHVNSSLDAYDMLFVPGGFGTRQLQRDANFIDWLKGASPVPLKVSVCTGALLLGAAGFLKGRRATTHPGVYEDLRPYCGEVVRERIVDEGDLVTAGGVAASIDLGLHIVERLSGPSGRARIAAQMDYPYQYARG